MPPWLPDRATRVPGRAAAHRRRDRDDPCLGERGTPEAIARGRLRLPPEFPSACSSRARSGRAAAGAVPARRARRRVFRHFRAALPSRVACGCAPSSSCPAVAGSIHHAVLFTDTAPGRPPLDALDREPATRHGGRRGARRALRAGSPGRHPRASRVSLAWEIARGWTSCSAPSMPDENRHHRAPESASTSRRGRRPRSRRPQPRLEDHRHPRRAPAYTVRRFVRAPGRRGRARRLPHAHYLCREIMVEAALPTVRRARCCTSAVGFRLSGRVPVRGSRSLPAARRSGWQ